MTLSFRFLALLAWMLLGTATVPTLGTRVDAQECHYCKRKCQPCELCPVTIHCPTVVVETQMRSCVVEEIKEREETYTVFQRVPITQRYTKKTCYLADEVVSKEITQTRCKRVDNPVTRTYAVDVPVTEIHQGTRKRQVCDHCGQLWCIEEPCQCRLTRLVKETATEECVQPDVVFETTKCTIDYCKKVPKIKEEFCAEEVVHKLVPVEKTRTVQVCVPKLEKYPVDVQVTKMLPYEVMCCQHCMAVRAKQKEREQKEHKLKFLDRDEEHKLHAKLQKLADHERDHKMREKFQEKCNKLQGKCDKLRQHHEDGLLGKLFAKKDGAAKCHCEHCQR